MSLVPVVFTGARAWENHEIVNAAIRKLIKVYGTNRLIIIEGGQVGLDTIAANEARSLRVHVAEVEALWLLNHKAAGPIRNQIMLKMAEQMSDTPRVVAFHWDLNDSRGTADCIRRAEKMNIKVNKIIVRKQRAMPSAFCEAAPMGKRAREDS